MTSGFESSAIQLSSSPRRPSKSHGVLYCFVLVLVAFCLVGRLETNTILLTPSQYPLSVACPSDNPLLAKADDNDNNYNNAHAMIMKTNYSTSAVRLLPSSTTDPTSTTTTSSSAQTPLQTTPFSSRFSLENYRLPEYYGQPKPTLDVPFIFFHQRKAGGTTMRDDLVEMTDDIGVARYIPGYDNGGQHRNGNNGIQMTTEKVKAKRKKGKKGAQLDYETYHTPQTGGGKNTKSDPDPFRGVPVYGGHLYYTSFMRTLYLHHMPDKPDKSATVEPPEPKYTCLTTFREPVSRIESCWNYRMVQQAGKKGQRALRLDSTTTGAADIQSKLTTGLSKFGEGCLNEPMRIFSDYGNNEYTVNRLHLQPPAVIDHAMNQTVTRMGQCVVGILERCGDTKKALELHLPFLAPYLECSSKKLNTGRIEKGAMNEEQLAAVQELAAYEEEIYRMANKLLDEQIREEHRGQRGGK